MSIWGANGNKHGLWCAVSKSQIIKSIPQECGHILEFIKWKQTGGLEELLLQRNRKKWVCVMCLVITVSVYHSVDCKLNNIQERPRAVWLSVDSLWPDGGSVEMTEMIDRKRRKTHEWYVISTKVDSINKIVVPVLFLWTKMIYDGFFFLEGWKQKSARPVGFPSRLTRCGQIKLQI